MAVTVNSRFLSVGSGEPNISAGWAIRFIDYKDMTSLVAVAGEFKDFSFTMELNAAGTGNITFDEDSPFWTAILNNGNSNRVLLNNEYVIEAWDNGVPRFAWLAQTVTNTEVGEDETRAVTISGPGIAGVLSRAAVGRPGFPTKVPIISRTPSQADPNKLIDNYRATSSSDMLPAFGWEFTPTWPTMRMWYTVFKAAQRRGLLSFVKPMFTATQDSAKQDWIWVKTIEAIASKLKFGYQPADRNQTLLEFLSDCTGQDYSKWFGQRLEWLMYPGFKLDVRRHIGTDRSATVRFFQGNIISDERTRTRDEIRNRVVAMDVIGNESIRTDKASVARWGLREQWNETHKNVTVDTLRNQIADRLITQSKDEKDQYSIRIPYDDPGRVPFRNFYVGDHVGLNVDYLGNTPTAVSAPTKYRVIAITVSMSSDKTYPDCELTLKSTIDSRLERLEKEITQLLNNPANVKIDDIKDVSVPAAPTVKSTLVYNPDTKKWEPAPISELGGGGNQGVAYVQETDPATVKDNTVKVGDFWLETYG